ncbi:MULTISPECIES: ATP-binding protein [unclassified Motilimonas]|uniref:ATP-binding protein n=1 Tax=Motilimonas TaxID=1914248 RepID=UPI001E37EF2F|nr:MULTISPECIES: ATP-binding protein [unclassified Motilimonas]MCE0558268.1 ATP-binding protein [Motilimonas sp. E26]MDO6524632.1 ATP-binding protein [Motilimonas sp. 1_MG-2023]
MPKQLTLIRGLPGSGKSTLAQTLDGVHLEADQYFVNEQGIYCFEPSLLPAAHRWCLDKTREYLLAGHSVVVANTFIEHWEMQPYVDLARSLKIPLEVKVCKGQYENIHDVPADTIKNMRQKWQH